MLPLYAARIEDLGPGEFVKVDCAACHHVALLPPEALRRGGLSPAAKVLDLKEGFRCRGRFVNWYTVPRPIPPTITRQLLRSAFYVLYLHEQFHHKVESLGFRLLIAVRQQ